METLCNILMVGSPVLLACTIAFGIVISIIDDRRLRKAGKISQKQFGYYNFQTNDGRVTYTTTVTGRTYGYAGPPGHRGYMASEIEEIIQNQSVSIKLNPHEYSKFLASQEQE